jgi:hypothetical protein
VVSARSGQTYMLDLMAGWAERDEPDQLLHMSLVVIVEHLMAFDRPLLSAPGAYLANIARAHGR